MSAWEGTCGWVAKSSWPHVGPPSEQRLPLPSGEVSYAGGWSEPVGHFLHSLHGSLEKSASFKITVTLDYFPFSGGTQGTLGHLFQKLLLWHNI